MLCLHRIASRLRACTRPVSIPLLLLLLLPTSTLAAAWQFQSLADKIPQDNDFAVSFNQRTFSLATTVNNYGNQFGVYALPEEITKSYNVYFSDDPEFSAVDSENFISLAAGEPSCFWGVCVEQPFGIRLTETEAFTNWLGAGSDTSPAPGSLPFSRFPGNFVSENGAGVVATTQVSAEGQFSMILEESRESALTLPDIAWVVALSSGTEPLVLGYRGDHGHCLIYGEGCEPPECEDADSDGHTNTRGRGHREHGRGHGYGHDHADCDAEQTGSHTDEISDEPTLIKVYTDNTTDRWTFPRHLGEQYNAAAVEQRFPLTMNDDQVILRGTVQGDAHTWSNRLLQCRLGTDIDTDGDGVVNCEGGLAPLVPLAEAPSVDTVLGFSLNAEGLLIGNYGFNAAGMGTPFLVDTAAEVPRTQPLRNRTGDHAGWELNTVTDINQQGLAVGYGHHDCSSTPDGYTLYPATDAEAPDLALQHVVQPDNGAVSPGETFSPAVDVAGGSGNYLYRVDSKRPEDIGWHAEHGWRETLGTYSTSSNYEGDLCLRIQIQDSSNADLNAETLIRFRVTDSLDSGAAEQDLIGDRETGDAESMLRIGGMDNIFLLALTLVGILRRRRV